MLRANAAQLPRVQAVLVEELAGSVLADGAVQLAIAILREPHPDARLALALRLSDAIDPVGSWAPSAGAHPSGKPVVSEGTVALDGTNSDDAVVVVPLVDRR
jgi:hypothetical protein